MHPIAGRFRGFLPVVVDIETGGFNPKTDALLEIAVVTLDVDDDGRWQPKDTVASHVEAFPGANIEQSALEFNGIIPDHPLRFALPEREALQKVLQPVRQAVKTSSCTRAVLPSMTDLAVFDHFATETRSLIIHRDASLMPLRREDWRSLNVTCASDRDAASLTVWLNAFYPELRFEGDVFETWAPRTPPSDVVREVVLPRVVQTVDQHKLHAGIAALQGRNGVYFAGAHVVPGMGLLEQACAAGDAAAAGALSSLRAAGFEC